MTVADALKRFRADYGLSQKEVADTVGMIPTSYYRYESGRFLPQVDIIITLAKKYNVSADYLLGLSNVPQPSEVDAVFFSKVAACVKELQGVLEDESSVAPKAVGA